MTLLVKFGTRGLYHFKVMLCFVWWFDVGILRTMMTLDFGC